MGIKKSQRVRGGVDVPDADHRIIAITVHAGSFVTTFAYEHAEKGSLSQGRKPPKCFIAG